MAKNLQLSVSWKFLWLPKIFITFVEWITSSKMADPPKILDVLLLGLS